jgi:glycosyltransferase involved in cell wall biosynthesis
MNVLLVAASYRPVLGGLQTVTHQLAQELVESGHRVVVVTNRHPRSLPAHDSIAGIRVERLAFFPSCRDALGDRRIGMALASAVHKPLTSLRLDRIVERFRPDVVNVHFPDARLAPILAARRRHPFRLVVSLHGEEVESWGTSGPGRTAIVRTFLRSATAVTACSRYLLEWAERLEPSIAGRAHVIHNGVDLSRFRETVAYPHRRPYVLAYGRHTFKKGFDLLLRAFAALATSHQDVDLVLAGEGEDSAELERLRDELGLRDRVVLYGRASEEEIVRLLNGCRLAVIPSRREPFGIVALEVLLSGRPLVATRVGGIPEVVAALRESVTGDSPAVRWAEPESSDLARAIAETLEGPATPMRIPLSAPRLSQKAMARAYLSVLRPSEVRTTQVSGGHPA